MNIQWTFYWTGCTSLPIIDPPQREMLYRTINLNEAYRFLAQLLREHTDWKGFVGEWREQTI